MRADLGKGVRLTQAHREIIKILAAVALDLYEEELTVEQAEQQPEQKNE